MTMTTMEGDDEQRGRTLRRWGLLKCFGERRYDLAVAIPKVLPKVP